MHSFFKFSTDFGNWIGTLKRVDKEKMCCPEGLFEEFIAVFQVKVIQIDTENDKIPKFSKFQRLYTIFF